MGGAGLSWRGEQSGAQAPRLRSSLGPGDQPSESGVAAPWDPSLPNPALGPPTSWDPIFATQTNGLVGGPTTTHLGWGLLGVRGNWEGWAGHGGLRLQGIGP